MMKIDRYRIAGYVPLAKFLPSLTLAIEVIEGLVPATH